MTLRRPERNHLLLPPLTGVTDDRFDTSHVFYEPVDITPSPTTLKRSLGTFLSTPHVSTAKSSMLTCVTQLTDNTGLWVAVT